MRRSKFVLITVFTLTTVLLIGEFGAAMSRRDSLCSFLKNNQSASGWFRDSNNNTSSNPDVFVSYANVFLLNQFEKLSDITNDTARIWFRDQFLQGDLGNRDDFRITFAAHEGYKILGGSFNKTDLDTYATYINSRQDSLSGGFYGRDEPVPTAASTYYALAMMNAMNRKDNVSSVSVVNYIISLWDNTVGAFKGSNQSTANLIDTFYAVKSLELLSQITNLTAVQTGNLSTYVESFYIDDSSLTQHFGGYSISKTSSFSSILMTYMAVGILDVLKLTTHSQTVNWLLSRQNPDDNGFQDVSDISNTLHSSAVLSYYAISALNALDSSAKMDDEAWNLSINPWILAALIIGVVGGIIIICIVIWKFKNRM